ncbi:hypothetical protein [Stenotrophomonas sepilia]|uniref:hypothetical protein n=1 Tax=Stenotrophomonas sepilia TaxID=2860290 RepID=UPI002E7A743F|nr:hypothetical protein [Stenotrophomonas sepilia]
MKTKKNGAVSKRDAAIACVISLGMGAILTAVILIGSDIPLRCVSAGAASDWMAAAGTWVIGYGAWKYAKEAHQQRMREYFEVEGRRIRTAYMQIWALRDRVSLARTAAVQMTMVDAAPDGSVELSARSACAVGASVLADLVWRPEDTILLSEKVIRTQGRVSLGVTQMKGIFARGNSLFERRVIEPAAAQAFSANMVDVGKEIVPDFNLLIEQLSDTMTKIRNEAQQLVERRNEMFS